MNADEFKKEVQHLFGDIELTDEQMNDEQFIEQYRRERDRAKRVEEAIRVLIDECNGGSIRGEIVPAIVVGITRGHRYLQNSIIEALIMALGTYGALPAGAYVDGRNEYAHRHCQKIREVFMDLFFYRDGRPT